MPVQETSKQAFKELKADTIDGIVYAVFAEGRTFEMGEGNFREHFTVSTRRECAEYLKMQASTVSGAVHRLIKGGWLGEQGKLIDQYTRKLSRHVVAVRGVLE